MSVEWEWGHYGRCFVDHKFSHGVRFNLVGQEFQCSVWDKDGNPEMYGMMLGAFSAKTLPELIEYCEVEAKRVVTHGCSSLPELKRKLGEYPWRRK